jgi:outer membrane receptor for ferrienterochelin and colicin
VPLRIGQEIQELPRRGVMRSSILLVTVLMPGVLFAQSDSIKVVMEGVVVSTNRSTRTIQDIPTRIEIIAGEELVEKGNMRPGDIRMLLNEMTGITIRQESSFLGEAGIRMQGLDRRFTQVLKDGFPLYDGLSGGLGLLQTPPLDLERVDIIKGPASTLYGAGAVAGLVNLVSRRPGDDSEFRVLLNGTTAGGTDASILALIPGRIGSSTYVQGGWQSLYDPSDEGFAAIPESSKLYVRQSLFAKPSASTDIQLTGTYSNDDRTGGAMSPTGYRIRSESELKSAQAVMSAQLGAWRLQSRSSLSRYDRMQGPRDHQTNRFSELTASSTGDAQEIVLGAAVQDVAYGQSPEGSTTLSLFGNWTRELTSALTLEAGYRLDQVDPYGTQHLPRVSLMLSPSLNQTYRISGGMGYVLPTLYLDSRYIPSNYFNLTDIRNLDTERSLGGTADINIRSDWYNLNVMGFLTRVQNGLEMNEIGLWIMNFYTIFPVLENRSSAYQVQGVETNLKLDHEPFALYLGHTFTDSDADLVSRHRFNSVLMIEEEDAWRIGLEAYYHGQQNIGKPYVIAGIMADYRIGFATVFMNLENVFDVRQTRFERVYSTFAGTTVPISVMSPLYAPLDGRILNGGLRFEF